MRCEYCSRKLGKSEVVHGIRFGAVDDVTDMFIPDKASAVTVICQSCGEMLLRHIYSRLINPYANR